MRSAVTLAVGTLNGAPHKVEQVAQFHVGETVCAITKVGPAVLLLQPGGSTHLA